MLAVAALILSGPTDTAAVVDAGAAGRGARVLLSDPFDVADGLITNEYATGSSRRGGRRRSPGTGRTLWLRYKSEAQLYIVSVVRRDGAVVVK